MLGQMKFRIAALATHGILAICLGVSFFYLRATMTNLIFELFATVIAIMLSAAALLVAALGNWFFAFSEGLGHIHRFTFYLLAGFAFALAGVIVGAYPPVSMQWLVMFAAIHACLFGISALVFAFRANRHVPECHAMYFFGIISVLFSGVMAGLARGLGNSAATAALGWYMCFVGVKMLFFAWNSHCLNAISAKVSLHGAVSDGARRHERVQKPGTIVPSNLPENKGGRRHIGSGAIRSP
jgi:hypothetical protein